jgi:hypothetical protein
VPIDLGSPSDGSNRHADTVPREHVDLVREVVMAWVESGRCWFGVRVWKTWAVQEQVGHLEEAIYLVKASAEQEAREFALRAASRDESDFLNELNEPVKVRVYKVGHVYDLHKARLNSGAEAFSLLYELDEEGDFDFGFPFEDGELGEP